MPSLLSQYFVYDTRITNTGYHLLH